MNSENSRTYEYHVLVLNLTDKLDLRRGQKSVALSNLSIYYTWEKIKAHTITINLKYLLHHGVMNLNYQMDHIQYHIQDYFKYILKKHSENVNNPSIRIYVNKIENRNYKWILS